MKLYERKQAEVVVGDTVYPFRDDFRLFLKAYDLLKDPDIFDEDKVTAVCRILFLDVITDLELGVKLINGFFRLYENKKKGGQSLFSFNQDCEYIYAGFMQAYGINLYTAELTIEEFLALMKGLPKGTRFSEVVEIRSMPIPKANKYNTEQINAILRAKRDVRLESDKSNSNGWKEFGNMIKALAKRGKR